MSIEFPPLKYWNLPNMITSLAIAISVVTLLLLYQGIVPWALAIYPLVFLCDSLDGFVARKLALSSRFGEELDTLADSLSFALMPVCLAICLGFDRWFDLVFLGLYALSGFWRLAYYNLVGTTRDAQGRAFFQGVPTPPCAGWLYILLSCSRWYSVGWLLHPFLALCTVLMVSSVRYKKYHNFISDVLVGLLLIFAFLNLLL